MCDAFDIFRKSPEGGMVWIASSKDLEAAKERIKLMAANEPREYIVFCQATQEVVEVSTPAHSKNRG
jgi:dipeptidase